MNAIARKLSKALGVDYDTALLLVEAGLTTENRARRASKTTLTAIAGIGSAMADKIRGK